MKDLFLGREGICQFMSENGITYDNVQICDASGNLVLFTAPVFTLATSEIPFIKLLVSSRENAADTESDEDNMSES